MRGHRGWERCWWFTAARQGLLPKAAPRLVTGSRICSVGGGFVLFFGGFPKNGAFCNPPSPSTELFLAEPLKNFWELSFRKAMGLKTFTLLVRR